MGTGLTVQEDLLELSLEVEKCDRKPITELKGILLNCIPSLDQVSAISWPIHH